MLAAAARSGGVTTAMTYEVRVGTSICDRKARTNSSTTATPSPGANGRAARHPLAGRWVNTMVLTRPMRRASSAAVGYDMACSSPLQKKIAPAAASDRPKCS